MGNSSEHTSKKIYLLPNLVTTANMCCGFYAIISAMHYDYAISAWAILAAGVFDLLDGRVARLAKATSSFGVEYDSLSDLLSFGVAPAILTYTWALEPLGRFGWVIAFFLVACGAFRLARFNVSTDKIPKGFFQGLPIPVAAGTISSFVILNESTQWMGWPAESPLKWIAPLMTILLGFFMVSTIYFPSFKEFNWRSKGSFWILFIAVMSGVLIISNPEIALFAVSCLYVFGSVLWNFFCALKGTLPRKVEFLKSQE